MGSGCSKKVKYANSYLRLVHATSICSKTTPTGSADHQPGTLFFSRVAAAIPRTERTPGLTVTNVCAYRLNGSFRLCQGKSSV